MIASLLTWSSPLLSLAITAPQDWPELRGPNQDGSVRAVDVFSQPFELRTSWSRPLGSGYSSVVVAGSLVIGTFSDGVEDCVVALNVTDGSEAWRRSFGPTYPGQQGSEDGPTSTPCIRDGAVFAPGPRGRVLALELDTGAERWSCDLAARFGAQFTAYGFGASPVLVGDVVYQPFGSRNGVAGVALNPHSGEVSWTHHAGWVDYQSSLRHPAGDHLLAVDSAGLALLDPRDGTARFRTAHPVASRDMAYPQVVPIDASRFLFTYENEAVLHELDSQSGALTQVWQARDLKQCYAPPVVHGDMVYGLSGTFLVGVELASGRRLWKSREPGARGLILVDEHLVLLSSRGDLVVAPASRDGFEVAASVHVTDRGGFTPPVFGAGRLFVRNTAGLTCVEIVRSNPETVAAVGVEENPLPQALSKLLGIEDSTARSTAIDAWWSAADVPVLTEEHVHFFYRGEADDVAILGDMTRDRTVPHSMHRITGTDLFHRAYALEPNGLWQYAFLIDFEHPVLDPRNPRKSPALAAIHGNPQALGYVPLDEESVLTLPGWERPEFLDGRSYGGGHVETLPYASRILRANRDLTVYLPEGFDPGEGLPVLYITGGELWFEHGELKAALDALMDERCQRAVVVALPFHVGSADRMGGSQYARAIVSEVSPLIAEAFGTGTVEVALGASDDATGVLALAALAPERFRRIAAFSPAADPEDLSLLLGSSQLSEALYLDWSKYETRLADENIDYRTTALELSELFQRSGSTVAGGEVTAGPGFPSWSARIDRALAFLLPFD